MRFKKQKASFVPIFKKPNGDTTVESFRTEEEEFTNEKGEKETRLKVVRNDLVVGKDGKPFMYPLNRKARRMRDKEKRSK